MAGPILFANNAISTLAGAITNTATTANLAAGSGILFPNPSTGQYFKMTLIDALSGNFNEIVHVTNISTDTITIVRGQEGTTPLPWLAGDFAQNLCTAGSMASFLQATANATARIITLSGVFTMTTTDGAVGLQRTTSLAASSTTLPTGTAIGQIYYIEDLVGNFQAYPMTVNAPSGHNIANLPGSPSAAVLNINRQCAGFRYYGSNVWSVNGLSI
jgi:hypothetical protein